MLGGPGGGGILPDPDPFPGGALLLPGPAPVTVGPPPGGPRRHRLSGQPRLVRLQVLLLQHGQEERCGRGPGLQGQGRQAGGAAQRGRERSDRQPGVPGGGGLS